MLLFFASGVGVWSGVILLHKASEVDNFPYSSIGSLEVFEERSLLSQDFSKGEVVVPGASLPL